jgi:hypothetical protein
MLQAGMSWVSLLQPHWGLLFRPEEPEDSFFKIVPRLSLRPSDKGAIAIRRSDGYRINDEMYNL